VTKKSQRREGSLILKKRKISMRLLAMLLTFTMVIGIVPTPVLADYNDTPTYDVSYEIENSGSEDETDKDFTGNDYDKEITEENGEYEDESDEGLEEGEINAEPLEAQILPLSEETITVFITFEGYNLGHGFYVEPTAITLPLGLTAAHATVEALNQVGIRANALSTTWNADTNLLELTDGLSGFYLSSLHGVNKGFVNLPSYLANRTPWVDIFQWNDAVEGGNLGEFDFTSSSGWKITVNHVVIDAGAGSWDLKNGDVIRWQFTVYGHGSDLGVPSGWVEPIYHHTNKTDLIRSLFIPGATLDSKQAALDVIINPLATTEQVTNALLTLQGEYVPETNLPENFWFEIHSPENPLDFITRINAILVEEFGQTYGDYDYSVVERLRVTGVLPTGSGGFFNWGANIRVPLGPYLVELDLSGLTGGAVPIITQWSQLESIIMPAGRNATGGFSNNPSLERITWVGNVETVGPSSISFSFFQNTPSLRYLIFHGDTAPNFSNNQTNANSMFNPTWTGWTHQPVAYVRDNTTGGFELEAFRRHFAEVRNLDVSDIPVADKEVLDEAIANAKALSESDYTHASWAFMQTALAAAQMLSPVAAQADVNNATARLIAAIDALIPYGYDITFISVPEGATVGVFRKGIAGNIHFTAFESFQMILDYERTEDAPGRDIWRARMPVNTDLHVEVYIPGQTAKRAQFIRVGSHGTIIDVELPLTHSWSGSSSTAWDDRNILTNLNNTGAVNLRMGGTFNLDTFRVWQAMHGFTENYFIEPEFRAEVVEGNNVTVDRIGVPGRERFAITATGYGLSIIRITFGALEYVRSGQTRTYAAIDERNVLYIPIYVGGMGSINTGLSEWRNDFDTFYFDKSAGYGELSFAPQSGSSVRVRTPGIGWTTVNPNSDGSFTAQLRDGRNIVEVSDGEMRNFHVIRARGVEVTVLNMTRPYEDFEVGDTAQITIRGITEPIEKLAGIYNPGFGTSLRSAIRYYTTDGFIESNRANLQYQTLISTFTVQYTLTDESTGVLEGRIRAGSMGSNIGAHRNIPLGGVGANMQAVGVGPYSFGALPVITLLDERLAPQEPDWEEVMNRGLSRIVSAISAPQFGSVGGEWAVLALARSGFDVPYGYFEAYIHQIGERLTNVGIVTDPNSTANGGGQFPLNRVYNPAIGRYEVRLGHQVQSTENSRLVAALTSLGIDASNFTHNGVTFDLIAQFGQRTNATSNQMWGEMQGINGPIWNLIALNSRGWDAPYEISDRTWVGGTTTSNPITITERIQWVLAVQLNNGGWNLNNHSPGHSPGIAADPDMTSMAIQALAPHRDFPGVEDAIQRALAELSRTQLDNGGWNSSVFGTVADNVQSAAQVVVALTDLGIDPQLDERFIMPNGNPVTTILRFFDEETGGFIHPLGGNVDQMATEQAVYALVAYWRFTEGMLPLYNMADAFAPGQIEVDRTALNAAIAAADERIESNYTPNSWASMQEALSYARLIFDNNNSTQLEVDAAVGALSFALNALMRHADLTALNTAIAAAEMRVQANYTTASWRNMQTSLSTATEVRDDANSTQNAVNEASNNLTAATNALVLTGGGGGTQPTPPRIFISVQNPNARSGDPTQFLTGRYVDIDAGETAYSILRRNELGLQVRSSGHAVWAGMYVEAINNWGEFDGGPLSGWMYVVNGIFPDFSSSLYELQDGDVLHWLYTYDLGVDLTSWGTGSFGANRSALRSEIARAEELNQADYTPASWAVMQTALAAARREVNRTVVPQSDIDAAANALREAIDALVSAAVSGGGVTIITPDVSTIINLTPQIRGRHATASVLTAQITDALGQVLQELENENEDAIGEVRLNIEKVDAASVSMTIPRSALGYIANNSDVVLTIQSGIATLTFDSTALTSIVAQSGENENVVFDIRSLTADELSEAQRDIVGENTLFQLTITAGSDRISDFGYGLVTVILPYTLIEGEDASLLSVFNLTTDNTIREIAGARYNSDLEGFVFTTNYFSLFFIDMPDIAVPLAEFPVNSNDVSWSKPFTDVNEADWFYDSVRFMFTNDLMNGTGAGQFSPDMNLTRAMLVTILWRLEGSPLVTNNSSNFNDVASDRWYSSAVAWASTNDIVGGYGNGIFGSNDNVTREQIAVILQNYAQFIDEVAFDSSLAPDFTDSDSISPWAQEAMKWANANGLITGRTLTTIAPNGTVTRAEFAAILQRFIEAQ